MRSTDVTARPTLALLAVLTMPTIAMSQTPLPGAAPTSRAAGAAPTELRAEPAQTSLKIRWACFTGPTGYEVFATPKGGRPIKLTATPIGPQCFQDLSIAMKTDPRLPAPTSSTYISSFTHSGLALGAEFTYVVRALYPNGYADSSPLTAQTFPWPTPMFGVMQPLNLVKPNNPSLPQAPNATIQGDLWVWARAKGVQKYRIWVMGLVDGGSGTAFSCSYILVNEVTDASAPRVYFVPGPQLAADMVNFYCGPSWAPASFITSVMQISDPVTGVTHTVESAFAQLP